MNNREFNSFTRHQRETWLQDCVAMFRDAVLTRRAATGEPTPVCIAQAAMQFGIKESRGKALFYNELLTIRREAWMAMKLAALRECDASVRLLQERLEARRMQRRQYELELAGDQGCGSGGSIGHASAPGAGIGVSMRQIAGKSDF